MDAFFELVQTDIPPRIRSMHLRALYSYWKELAQGGVPMRSELDPTRIKALLPYMMLVDLTEEPLRVFYRLVGTEVVRFTGLEFTGHYLEQLEFDEFDFETHVRAYRTVRDSGLPGVGVAQHFERGLLMIETEYLICPLRSDSGAINKCAVIESYHLGGGAAPWSLPPARLRGG
jgi:hypothetical protein